jgi:PilZ domain-containing protein
MAILAYIPGAVYRQMNDRASRIMQNLHNEQRDTERRPLCVAAKVVQPQPNTPEKVGLIRDVSRSGIFFYSNFAPEVGSRLTVSFTVPPSDANSDSSLSPGEITCTGKVVRVVKGNAGAATGIGLRLEDKDMEFERKIV